MTHLARPLLTGQRRQKKATPATRTMPPHAAVTSECPSRVPGVRDMVQCSSYRWRAGGAMRGWACHAGARAPPHSPRPCGSPVRHRQSADGPAHRARERTRGSLRHAIPTLLPMLREWYRVSRSSWPQRGFPSAPLAASSASRFRSPARMFPMSWFPSWQAYSYRRWSLRAMGMDTVQGFVQTVGSVIVHS